MNTKLLSTLFSALIFCGTILAQTGTNTIGHQRGMYVDDFINLIPSSIDPDENIDIPNSILGNILREDELLKYCMENHITYLTLYNMRNIFIKPASTALKINLLRDFICKAKTNFCIEYISGSVGLASDDNVGGLLRETSPYTFPAGFFTTYPQLNRLAYIQDTILPSDSAFYTAECLKLMLRLLDMDGTLSGGSTTYARNSGGSSCNGIDHLDLFTTEYEFWRLSAPGINRNYDDPSTVTNDYVGLINNMNSIRDLHNAGYPYNVFVETYLGYLEDPNHGNSKCKIAEFIDGLNSNGKKNVDRILGSYYDYIADELYNPPTPGPTYTSGQRHYREYSKRFLTFCEVEESPAPPAAPPFSYSTISTCNGASFNTLNNTNYEPLFNAGSFALGSTGDYLGSSIPLYANRNIFTAERDYYDDFVNDGNHTNIHDVTEGNDVVPGGVQWYTQSFMTKPLDHPITFLAYNSSCNLGIPQTISLVYQGPIEAGISYSYVVTNCVTGAVITAPTGASGTTPTYIGATTTAFPYTSVEYDLDPGTYCITLNLNYATAVVIPIR